MFVRLCARETKCLTKCWSKLSLLTNHRVYEELVYRNEVLKAMFTGSIFPSLPHPLAVFSRKFSLSAFLNILEPGKGYKWCYSLYVSVYIYVACGSRVIRNARHTLTLAVFLCLCWCLQWRHKATNLVRCFCRRFGDQKMFLALNFDNRENWTNWNSSFKIRAKFELKMFFSAVTLSHVSLLMSAMPAYRSAFHFGFLLLT